MNSNPPTHLNYMPVASNSIILVLDQCAGPLLVDVVLVKINEVVIYSFQATLQSLTINKCDTTEVAMEKKYCMYLTDVTITNVGIFMCDDKFTLVLN